MTKETVAMIKEHLSLVDTLSDERLKEYELDERKSVQQAVRSTKKRIAKQEELAQRFVEMSRFEHDYRTNGYVQIAGIDEVGRGPLAGPVVAASVILPDDFHLIEINDSKQLSKKKREELFDKIMDQAVAVGVGIVDALEIDEKNIYEATKVAMIQSVEKLSTTPDALLIDAMRLDLPIKQESIIKGDAKSISIACASVIAKVTRDRLMSQYHEDYPYYDFENNSGYGTKKHLEGLAKHGPCHIHRKSFEPIKSMIKK